MKCEMAEFNPTKGAKFGQYGVARIGKGKREKRREGGGHSPSTTPFTFTHIFPIFIPFPTVKLRPLRSTPVHLLMDCVEAALDKTFTPQLHPAQDNPARTTPRETWKGHRACFECRRHVLICVILCDDPNTDVYSFSSYRKKTKCEPL
jgi:hypothetical protein